MNRKRFWFKWFAIGGIIGTMITLVFFSLPVDSVHAQQPTGSIPTVTGTPEGPYITVYQDQDLIGVYAGPGSRTYEQIGVLASLETAPAIGRTADKNWIEIIYLGAPGGKGWVYAPLVSLSPGTIPVVAAPPTATPRTTPTLDPTYVAAFGVQLEPTHLPTFTAPAPLEISTFAADSGSKSKIPFGFILVGLALLGVLGAVISFVRGNR